MLTLAIDTATKVCAVALCQENEIIAEYRINAGMTHSEGLMPQIAQILERTKTKREDIELLAISTGPGSFTGLRIGLATVEAMAYSWQIPLVGIDTLKALAYNIPLSGQVLFPLLDAQKGNFYGAIYEWIDGQLIEHLPVSVLSAAEVLLQAEQMSKKNIFLGECKKLIEKGLPQNCEIAPESMRLPKASSVAIAGQNKFANGDKTTAFLLDLHYIRRSEAEELWEKRQQKN